MSKTAFALIPSQPKPLPAYGRFDELRTAVLNGVTADNSKWNYALALDELSAF